MKFFFIRHGETQYNLDNVAQGIDDSEKSQLNQTGKQQALEAGNKLLKDSDLKGRVAIITSFLGRAKETGKIIFDQLTQAKSEQQFELFTYGDPQQKIGLHEIDMGSLNAKLPKEELKKHFGGGEKFNEFLIGNNGDLNAGFSKQYGENRNDVRDRCKKSIEEIIQKYSSNFDAIIIVSHRYTIAEIIRMNGQTLNNEINNSEYFKAEVIETTTPQKETPIVGRFTQQLVKGRQADKSMKQLKFIGLPYLEQGKSLE